MRVTLCKLVIDLGTTADGLPILHGLVNRMGRASYPSPFPRTRLAVEIETDLDDSMGGGPLTVQLIDEDGMVLRKQEGEVRLPNAPNPGFRPLMGFDFDGSPEILQPGSYRFDVLYRGEVLGSERIYFE
ncbi:MAG: hypothetical protein IT202_03220 [Fimbriimonadaceae bacterium]|nr:hypothetical protein [Fimbriimonadaceae bacterium]